MIYIIRTRGSSPEFLKIGYSAKATRERIRKMQTGCPFPLELIFVCKGTTKDEKLLHAKMKPHHFRGEWFYCNRHSLKELGISENQKPLTIRPGEVAPGVTVYQWYQEENGRIHPSQIPKDFKLSVIET